MWFIAAVFGALLVALVTLAWRLRHRDTGRPRSNRLTDLYKNAIIR